MDRKEIYDIVDDEIVGAVDEIAVNLQNLINKEFNLAYDVIKNKIVEKYYAIANGNPTIDVKKAFEFINQEIQKKALTDTNNKRLYRSGYYQAIKDMNKIMSTFKIINGG